MREQNVIPLVNRLFDEAIEQQASDIHIDPGPDHVFIKIRVRGKLQSLTDYPHKQLAPIITRIKVMGTLDISEKRLPQEGRCVYKNIHCRMTTCPTAHGEKIAIRLFNTEKNFTLDTLGIPKENLQTIEHYLAQPNGLLITCGSTGSGKTSTLYACLKHIDSTTRHILTLEDPVEQILPNINQCNINPTIGFPFQSALKTSLRLDPDVLMIGEIRDQQSAHICLQAAETGHLVLSSLHTRDCDSAIHRLQSLGIRPTRFHSIQPLLIGQTRLNDSIHFTMKDFQ